jgi:hypothetical protein
MTTRGPSELARIKLRHPLWTFWQDADGLSAARGSAIVRGASLGALEARLTEYEHPRSRPGALARDFPDWQISIRPAGVGICTAYWCSPDGRSRRYVVARSSAELLARLRAIGPAGRPS